MIPVEAVRLMRLFGLWGYVRMRAAGLPGADAFKHITRKRS
jgi:hypothetical protein